MQNVKKTYKTQKWQEKICLIASCWLVIGRENKKNSAMNYKTYKTQNQREKLCPTASCWLVVCRENKKKKKSATNKILKTYKTQNQMEK